MYRQLVLRGISKCISLSISVKSKITLEGLGLSLAPRQKKLYNVFIAQEDRALLLEGIFLKWRMMMVFQKSMPRAAEAKVAFLWEEVQLTDSSITI